MNNDELPRWRVKFIQVGKRTPVQCHCCSMEAPVTKKNRSATSGFQFVTGQIIIAGARFWKIRNLGNKVICHDCEASSRNWGC